MLKGLIIEDDEMASKHLKHLCNKFDDLEILGNYTNGLNAIKAIHALNLDFILLDIETPDLNGIDFVKFAIDLPSIIFTTASPHYASDAMQLGAVDFLNKPIMMGSLFGAIEKVKSIKQNDNLRIQYKNQNINLKLNPMNKNESIDLKLDHQENLEFHIGEKKEEENRAFSIVNRKDGERANPNIPLWKSVHSKW